MLVDNRYAAQILKEMRSFGVCALGIYIYIFDMEYTCKSLVMSPTYIQMMFLYIVSRWSQAHRKTECTHVAITSREMSEVRQLADEIRMLIK